MYQDPDEMRIDDHRKLGRNEREALKLQLARFKARKTEEELQYFRRSMIKRFSALSAEVIDQAIEESLKKIAPSRERIRLRRSVIHKLKSIEEGANSSAAANHRRARNLDNGNGCHEVGMPAKLLRDAIGGVDS
jgi:hypothetical protein